MTTEDDPLGRCRCRGVNRKRSACNGCPWHVEGKPGARPTWNRNDPRGDPPEFENKLKAAEAAYENRVKGDPK